jgi:two-component system, NtrC family, response regulator HydG
MTVIQPARILIADDEPNMRVTLSAILRAEGYQVDLAENGLSAVEKSQQNAYDVILMDVRMPGLDGVEAFRQMRMQQCTARVILMSAYGIDDLKQMALTEGAIAFLDKPLDIDKVIHLIQETYEVAILVVAADPTVASSLQQNLDTEHYRITIVDSADAALNLLAQIHFDIVFIDVHLPVMNGLEFYLALRKVTPTAIAIMIATMEAEAEALARSAVRQTAYTFIHKPINLDDLLELLDTLHRQQSSAALRKPAQDISL